MKTLLQIDNNYFAQPYEWTRRYKEDLICGLCRFRLLGRLESKYEDTMTEYYLAFISMCKKVAGIRLSEEEGRRHFFSLSSLKGTQHLRNIPLNNELVSKILNSTS